MYSVCGGWTMLNVSLTFALQMPCVVGCCGSYPSLLGTPEFWSSGDVMKYTDHRHGLSVYVGIENTCFSLQEYSV